MGQQSANIDKFVEILKTLNRFLGDYPIYLYLIDRNYRLIWANTYLTHRFSLSDLSEKPFCYQALWGMGEKCSDCPGWEILVDKNISRDILERRISPGGEEMYLELISLPVVNQDKEIEGMFKIGLDVTRIEREQRAIQQQEKLFASIIDTSVDAIFFLDNEDKFLSWNKGAMEIFGYKPEEVIGRSNVMLIPRELIELGELYYIKQELETKGFIRKYETQRLNKQGQIIYVDLTRTLIRDERGEPKGSSVIIKDITSRKELEFELRRTILELSKLNEFNEILYGTYILEDIYRIILIAITAGEGLRFNRAFLLLYNPERESLEGHLAVGPADEHEAHLIWSGLQDHFRSLKDVFQMLRIDVEAGDRRLNEIVRQIEIPLSNTKNLLVQSLKKRRTFYIRNGQLLEKGDVDFQVNGDNLLDMIKSNTFVVVPLFTKTEPIGVIIADNQITRRDISEEDIESLKLYANQASLAIENAKLYKKLEARIQELQEAYRRLEDHSRRLVKAERLAAIGEMSAKVAHEIRNPLVSIGGFARILERKLGDNEDLKRYASIIKNQVSNLEAILNNILSIATPRKVQRHSVEMHAVIQQVLMMLEEALEKRKIKVDLQFTCENSIVWGDEKQLFQVMLNLMKNSIEAIGAEGLISLQTRCGEEHLEIVVRDTGAGIPEEHKDKIYDLFFTTKKDGTGLGLSIVRQIIEDHEGKIHIESFPGKGTTVKIHLPFAKEKEEVFK
ncbi:MAG: hypothetical protein Kow0042_21100 [Calditrichia bacterium]